MESACLVKSEDNRREHDALRSEYRMAVGAAFDPIVAEGFGKRELFTLHCRSFLRIGTGF